MCKCLLRHFFNLVTIFFYLLTRCSLLNKSENSAESISFDTFDLVIAYRNLISILHCLIIYNCSNLISITELTFVVHPPMNPVLLVCGDSRSLSDLMNHSPVSERQNISLTTLSTVTIWKN